MASADVTLRTLSLGAQDSMTGWYSKAFGESTIKMIVVPRGATFQYMGMGWYAKHDVTGYTEDAVVEGDEIKDSFNNYYEVKAIKDHFWLNTIIFRECELVKLPLHADRPATSGTWPTVDDPRYATKAYLTSHLTANNMKEDDNLTNALYIIAMGLPDYSISKVFLGPKNVDLVFSIGTPDSEALSLGVGYAENVPVSIFTINKTGITGTRLRWAAEAELRRVCETDPHGSLRTLDRLSDNEENLGSTILYSVTYVMRYKRYA